MEIGTFIRIFDKQTNEPFDVEYSPEDLRLINAAIPMYTKDGVDTVLNLKLAGSGALLFVLTSSISSWLVSMPEGRLKTVMRDKAFDDETKRHRELAGHNKWEEEETE